MNNHKLKKIIFVLAMCVFVLFSFILFTEVENVIAQETVTSQDDLGYEPLTGTGIPGVGTDGELSLAGYLNAMFRLFLGLASVLAVLMIVVGGFQYMTSTSEPGTKAAKERISNAIIGLLIALAAWLILYEVNPDLLNFNLNLNVSDETTIEGGDDGKTCNNCQSVEGAGVPAKSPGAGCKLPGPCMVESSVLSRLKTFNSRLAAQNLSWQVTEMYPPTVQHQNPCHSNGTCVDANLTGGSNVASNVQKFINTASDSGLTACYEVKTSAERDRLINDFGVSPDSVVAVSQITGNHFSVYSGGKTCR